MSSSLDYVAHVPFFPEQEIQGPEGWKEVISEFRTAFPDMEAGIGGIIAENETVAVRYSWRGTHKGELLGIEPTEKMVETTGMAFLRFDNGKRTEEWIIEDTFGLLQQI